MSTEWVTIVTGLVSALATYFVARSKDKTNLVDTNLAHTTKLFEQYENTVGLLSKKVDNLEVKLDLAEEEHELEMQSKTTEIKENNQMIAEQNKIIEEQNVQINILHAERGEALAKLKEMAEQQEHDLIIKEEF